MTATLAQRLADIPTVVTDGGLETWLVFHRDVELPAFAAYPLAGTDAGRRLLAEYYRNYVDIAERHLTGVLLETPTWRANPEWAATLGHDLVRLRELIGDCVDVLHELRRDWTLDLPFVVSGALGPRGDGYRVDAEMSAAEAADYHRFQIGALAECGVDLVSAMTIGYVGEAVGVAWAAASVGLSSVISFTVETDGRLPSGMALGEAIEATDAASPVPPLHYMVNCAHPSHFEHVLAGDAPWVGRIGGIRANSSTLSHAELDEMQELDDGDPGDLAERYLQLRRAIPGLKVIGGCCGTDERHVEAIASAWTRTDATADRSDR